MVAHIHILSTTLGSDMVAELFSVGVAHCALFVLQVPGAGQGGTPGDLVGDLDSQQAQRHYHQRRESCRTAKRLDYRPLWKYLIERLGEGWRPEEVAGHLPIDYPDDVPGTPPTKGGPSSIYDTAAPSKNLVRPSGQWNTVTIIAKGNNIAVEMNGERVINTTLDRSNGGYIGLQNHDEKSVIRYRNIRVEEL